MSGCCATSSLSAACGSARPVGLFGWHTYSRRGRCVRSAASRRSALGSKPSLARASQCTTVSPCARAAASGSEKVGELSNSVSPGVESARVAVQISSAAP